MKILSSDCIFHFLRLFMLGREGRRAWPFEKHSRMEFDETSFSK